MRIFVLLLSITLAACAQPVARFDETSRPPLPDTGYIDAARAGATVYRILPQESLILVRVGRAGPVQRLGHEHAVASEDVQGYIEIGNNLITARADLVFPIRNLVVDKPAHRAGLELETKPSAADIDGTYANMLKVLDPARYPWVQMRARVVSGTVERPELEISVTLHGVTFEYRLAVELKFDGNRLIASGANTVRHADFGLEPFSTAGGLLRVADELAVEFRLVGELISPRSLGSDHHM